MADYIVKDETLADIADAIRHKTNSNEKIKVEDFAEQIGAISGGGGASVDTCTVTINLHSGQVLQGGKLWQHLKLKTRMVTG